MESTRFNLPQAINNYINNVKNRGTITAADAMELTAHLYDATSNLQQHHLTEEEAFMIACKRLGNEHIISEEYGKVNPSVNTNKIWAYLFIGFNVFYTVPSMLFMGMALFYYAIHSYLGETNVSATIVTLFHLICMVSIYYFVKQKNTISHFIERQINADILRTTILSFIVLLAFLFLLKPAFNRFTIYSYSFYPMRDLGNRIAELTYYLTFISTIGAVISLVFTINNKSELTIKTLLEKPSILFLICFGVVVQFVAASTRVFNKGELYVPVVLFGLVYFGAAFLIAYYNKLNNATKYILIALGTGFILETLFSIRHSIKIQNFYQTIYFVSSLLIGAFAGTLTGLKYGVTKKMVND